MKNNNYVSVGNIIEQERLRRQAQIAKGVNSDVYDHIEKAHQDDLSKGVEMTNNLSYFANDVDNLNKAETEFLLSKLQRQIVADPDSSLLKSFKSIAIDHLNDIEKGVYTDNAQNRKLGRVGQEYGGKGSRGGNTDEENGGRSWKNKEGSGENEKIDNQASGASTDALKRAAADKNAEPEVREAAKKELEERNGDKSNEDKEAIKIKKWRIRQLKEDGAGRDDSIFMSKNQEHFKDVLKKHGFDSFDDFEEWGMDHSDDDKDIKKYDRIYFQCVNKIPASKFKY